MRTFFCMLLCLMFLVFMFGFFGWIDVYKFDEHVELHFNTQQLVSDVRDAWHQVTNLFKKTA